MAAKWIERIEKGDILRSKSGLLRIVRAVHHSWIPQSQQIRTSVTFTIKRCSWTGRCYTILNGSDLMTQGYQHTGKRIRLQKKMDKEIAAEFGQKPESLKLTCCDVEYMP